MKKFILTVLSLGIFLRLVLSFTTYHSDVAAFDIAGKVISQGNILNLYDYLWQLPKDHPYLKVYPSTLFIYPPAIYFYQAGFSFLTTPIVDPTIHNNFILDFPSALGHIQLNLLLLLLKLPYLPFDIALAFLLMSLFKDERQKKLVFTLWIFNPVSLYATYMMGQFDIIPTLLTVAALTYVVKKKDRIESSSLLPAALLLGAGAAFKIFPVLFLVPLALLKKDWWGRIKIVGLGVLTYLITIFPFILSKGFRATAMLSGLTTKSFYAQIPISGGESIILFLAAVLFVYLVFDFSKNFVEDLWKKFFVLLLLFFVFTHYHPQWFVWLTPFLVIDLVKSNLKHWPLVVISLVSWLGLITFFDPGLSVWLFAPVFPNLWGLPGIWQLIGFYPDINIARSLLQTLFVGVAAYYIYVSLPKSEEKEV
jgi:hypothetical protein